jgi:carbon storage regulator
MLVLSRKIGERIVLPGCGVTVTVLQTRGNQVRLGIVAPAGVAVDREEVRRRLAALIAPSGQGGDE